MGWVRGLITMLMMDQTQWNGSFKQNDFSLIILFQVAAATKPPSTSRYTAPNPHRHRFTVGKTVEELEVAAMDRLVKAALRKRIEESRQFKAASSQVYFSMMSQFNAMSDNQKNHNRNIFRESIRKKILDPEANRGPVLGIADDHLLMREGIQAVQDLDHYIAAQQQNAAEQQNPAEEKVESPKDKGKGKRLFDDAGGPPSKRASRP